MATARRKKRSPSSLTAQLLFRVGDRVIWTQTPKYFKGRIPQMTGTITALRWGRHEPQAVVLSDTKGWPGEWIVELWKLTRIAA